MFEVTVSNTLAECKSLQPQWIELVESMVYPSPFVHPAWVLPALEANEREWTPYFVRVKKNSKLMALLPLYMVKDYSVRELRYIGDCYHPDPLGLCGSRENRKVCIDVIKEYFFQHNDWDVLRLHWLLHEEAGEWNAASPKYQRGGTIAPYLTLPKSFDVYLQTFKRKKRYNLNASVRKFERAGGCYCSVTGYKDKQDYLEHLFSIHEKRSEERNIISSFAGRHLLQFHESLLNKMDNVWLRSLEIEGKVIAVLYGFLYQGRFFYYQIAHDPSFRKQSPGTVLLYKVIEECCELGVKEFNFLQGDENYKWQWTKESRTLHAVTIYNRTLVGAVMKQKEKVYSMLKKIVSRQ